MEAFNIKCNATIEVWALGKQASPPARAPPIQIQLLAWEDRAEASRRGVQPLHPQAVREDRFTRIQAKTAPNNGIHVIFMGAEYTNVLLHP